MKKLWIWLTKDTTHRGLATIIGAFGITSAVIIGCLQININNKLIEAEYYPSVALLYDQDSKLHLVNMGNSPLYVHKKNISESASFDNVVTKHVYDSPFYLAPNTTDSQPIKINEPGSHFYVNYYLTDHNDQKYISKHVLFIDNFPDSVRVQTLGIFRENWH